MNICILGSGKVSTNLSQALVVEGHTIKAVFSLHLAHAQHLAYLVGCKLFTDCIQDLPKADAYIFMIKDSALPNAIIQLKENMAARHALWIHTSGSMPLNVFDGIKNTAVMYPLQTFSKNRILNFKKVPLFYEGNNETATTIIKALSEQLSDSITPLNSEQRKVLHLAAVFANNFTNHCCTLAYNLLSENGINPQLLNPIITETIEKLQQMSPAEAQTGPAIRWDTNVMQTHIKQLKDFPLTLKIYKLMSESIHNNQCK